MVPGAPVAEKLRPQAAEPRPDTNVLADGNLHGVSVELHLQRKLQSLRSRQDNSPGGYVN